MKDLIFFAVVAAVIWSGWMHIFVNYIPEKEAINFVEETRLLLEGGHLRANFQFMPPLPEGDFVLPKYGISPDFEVKKLSGPGIADGMDSRIIVYSVKFAPSESASGAPKKNFEYRMIQSDEGSYILPSWKVTRFITVDKYKREQKAAASGTKRSALQDQNFLPRSQSVLERAA